MGKSRLKAESDVVIQCKLGVCPDCGADLRVVGRSQVVEMPPIQPVVIEAQRYGNVCPVCGKEQRPVAYCLQFAKVEDKERR